VTEREQTYERQLARRLAQENVELDDPVVKAQLLLDHWVESERALARELNDIYEVGGFIEYYSKTRASPKAGAIRTGAFADEPILAAAVRRA
jgi:hypothetical protein